MSICQTVLCQDCRTFVQRLTNSQNIVTLPWLASSVDLAQIEHVWDMLGRNVRYFHDVRLRPQMITTLRREWVAIPEKDRTIIGPMRHRYTTCMRADDCQYSVTFKNDPYPVLLHFTKSLLNLNAQYS